MAYCEDRLENKVAIARKFKSSKVVIACLSDEYVKNKDCVEEFTFAKRSLNKVVIPIVVGPGGFDWLMSVVGLLIAGEMYIHFKDKKDQPAKMEELCTALTAHIDHCTVPKQEIKVLRTDTPDVFFSYCWKNSVMAKDEHQIQSVVGNAHMDPRVIKRELERAVKKNIWIDTERLGASNNSSSMFEQMALAIKDAQEWF